MKAESTGNGIEIEITEKEYNEFQERGNFSLRFVIEDPDPLESIKERQ